MKSQRIAPHLFLLPFFLMFAVFWIYPILYSFYVSLTQWDVFHAPQFIGLKNYVQLFSDPEFHTAMANTFMAAVVYIAVMVSLAIVLGLLLGLAQIRFKSFFRAAFFLPVTMSLVVVAIVFGMIFSNDFGLLNVLLSGLGLPTFNWLGDPKLALWSIVALRVWRAAGYYAIFILAGLQNIPEELYEAARLDGASEQQIIRKITLPLLKPMVLYVIIISSIWAFQLFDEPWVLTRGGPVRSTLTMMMYLYSYSFKYYQFGYGAAASTVLTAIILLFAFLNLKIFRTSEI